MLESLLNAHTPPRDRRPSPSNLSARAATVPGPGMLLRLRHLGFASPLDLADASPDRLREALGDISRLLDVESWIANAKLARASGTPDAG